MDSSLPVMLITPKSDYLKSMAAGFDAKTRIQGNFSLSDSANKESIPTAALNYDPNPEHKHSPFAYISGIAAAVGQAGAGLLLIPSSLLMRIENEKSKAEFKEFKEKSGQIGEEALKDAEKKIIKEHGESYLNVIANKLIKKQGGLKKFGEDLNKFANTHHLKGNKYNNLGWKALSVSWLISIPSCIGAAVNSKQPSMLLGSLIWGVAAGFMFKEKNHNLPAIIASTPLGASFVYAGLANKMKKDNELKEGQTARLYDFNEINRNNFISKSVEFSKFVIKDLISLPESGVKAVSQTFGYVAGKRKEPPEFWTIRPTENNSKLASLLLVPGSLLMMAFVKKRASHEKMSKVENIAGILIGAGLSFEALYMYTLGSAQKGISKALIIAGVPLRFIGDFFPNNPAMNGMRTLGGSSFEYYFATLNEDQKDKKDKK